MRKRWVQRAGKLIPIEEAGLPEQKLFYIAPDIQPYQSVITGEMITSRSHHRRHLKEHDAIEVGSEKPRWLKEKHERRQ